MRNLAIPAVLGVLLLFATVASRDADSQEALGSSLAKKPFQSFFRKRITTLEFLCRLNRFIDFQLLQNLFCAAFKLFWK